MRRLEEHNSGKGRCSDGKSLWSMVYLKEFSTKKDALGEERRLKRLNRKLLEKLIESSKHEGHSL